MLDLKSPLFDAASDAGGGGGAPSAPPPAPSSPAPITSAPPSDGSGGAAFDALLDSTLNSPSPADSSAPAAPAAPADAGKGTSAQGQPASPAAQPAASPEASAAATAEKIAGAQAEPEPEAENLLELDDDTADDEALADPAKPNLLDLKKPRGQRIYRSYKAYKEMSEAIGHEPSVEDIREYFESYSDQAAMMDEFLSGEPDKAANFIHFWNGTNPQAMATVAAQLPDLLANAGNQPAYVAMAMPVLQRYLNAKYNEAVNNRDPKMREAWTYVAQMLDYDLNGKFRQGDALKAPAADSALSQREAQVNAQVQQIQQFQQQQQAAANQSFVSSVAQANDSALDAAVEPIMKSLKATLPARVYSATVRDFKDAVKQHLAKDVEAERLYNIRLNQALRNRSSEDQEALTAAYNQRASRAIRALAPAFLKDAGIAAATQNAQTHQQLAQQAKAGAAPNSPGRPTQQSILPTQQQYASQGAKMEAMLDALLAAPRNG